MEQDVTQLSVVLTLVYFGASAFAWGFLFLRWQAGRPLITAVSPPARGPHWAVFLAYSCLTLLMLLMSLVAASIEVPELTDAAMLVELVVQLMLVGVVWVVVAFTTPSLHGWGVRRQGVIGQVGVGVLMAFAAFLPTLLLSFVTQHLGEEQVIIQQLRSETASPFLWAYSVIAAVVFAPLLEEMLFRVVLQGWLMSLVDRRRFFRRDREDDNVREQDDGNDEADPVWVTDADDDNPFAVAQERVGRREVWSEETSGGSLGASTTWWPTVVVAIVFCVVHGWPAMLGLVPFALMIGWLYRQTRSLISVIVMHATFNGSMMLMLAAELFGA